MVQVHFTLHLEGLKDQIKLNAWKSHMISYMQVVNNVSSSTRYFIGPMKKGGSNKKLGAMAIG